MWKYIVTYFVIMEFSFLKFSGDSEPIVAGVKIPRNTRYIEHLFDSIEQKATFDNRYSATEYIRLMRQTTAFVHDSSLFYFSHFKLDSIKVKK